MKKWLKSVCVVMTVLFLAAPLASGAVKKKQADEPEIRKWWERPKIVQKLELTDRQLSSIKDVYNEQYDQIVEARWNYRQQKGYLEDLLRRSDLDDERISRQTDQVQAARAVLEKTVTDIQTAMMRELSPEQRRKLLTILKNWPEKAARKVRKHKKDRKRKI